MNASQFYALMTCRRAMGDLDNHVALSEESFNELVNDLNPQVISPSRSVAIKTKQFSLNTCNGPTYVIGLVGKIVEYTRLADIGSTKSAERDKTTEEVTAERFQRLEGELKHLKTSAHAHARITECEKRHAALVCLLKERGVLWACDKL